MIFLCLTSLARLAWIFRKTEYTETTGDAIWSLLIDFKGLLICPGKMQIFQEKARDIVK